MENPDKEKVFAIRFTVKDKGIQTQMQTKNVSHQEMIGLLEMAKDEILDNVKAGRKQVFKASKKE